MASKMVMVVEALAIVVDGWTKGESGVYRWSVLNSSGGQSMEGKCGLAVSLA